MDFFTKIVGVTKHNQDGTQRQKLIKSCKIGDRLLLVREPDNPYDEDAVAVCRSDGKQLGYLSRQVAEGIAEDIDRGVFVIAVITDLTGGGWIFKRSRGVNIRLFNR